jgi:hypothetical protein
MARGEQGWIKRVVIANIKVFSQAGIRIIPQRISPQFKLIHANPIRKKQRHRKASFHTYWRYQKNSPQEVNNCITSQMLPEMRCLIC